MIVSGQWSVARLLNVDAFLYERMTWRLTTDD